MKLLVMVQSSLKPPYDKNMEAQKETWDSIKVDNVDTHYYICDEYNKMHWVFKLALDEVWDMDWDYIFRTNASTYVRKERIYNHLLRLTKNKPLKGLYAGVIGGEMISGTGILLSRDTAKMLKDQLDPYPTDSEDCCIGTILGKNGIIPQGELNRLAFNFQEDRILDADYYRCKSEIMMNGEFGYDNLDRSYDIKAFKALQRYCYP